MATPGVTLLKGDRRKLPFQVRDALMELISDDGYGPGSQLPTHADLASRCSVARSTIREALKLLEADGLVEIRHGSGTFISTWPRVSRPITRLEGMTEFLRAQGYSVTDRVMGMTVREPSVDERNQLAVGDGDEVAGLERARQQGRELLIYSHLVIPVRIIAGDPTEVDWSRPLLGLLDEMGHRIAGATSEIRASRLPEPVAHSLGIGRGEPFMLLRQRLFDEARRPVMLAWDYYRGTHFSFETVRWREA